MRSRTAGNGDRCLGMSVFLGRTQVVEDGCLQSIDENAVRWSLPVCALVSGQKPYFYLWLEYSSSMDWGWATI